MKHAVLITSALLGLGAMTTPLEASKCGPQVIVEFAESSPDFFTITNRSAADWRIETLVIDLGGSAGSVIFDTEFGGDGASMPEGFVAVNGSVKLRRVTDLKDGEQSLKLEFEGFAPEQSFEFFVDLDDRIEKYDFERADVKWTELAGAMISASMKPLSGPALTIKGIFDGTGKAVAGHGVCV